MTHSHGFNALACQSGHASRWILRAWCRVHEHGFAWIYWDNDMTRRAVACFLDHHECGLSLLTESPSMNEQNIEDCEDIVLKCELQGAGASSLEGFFFGHGIIAPYGRIAHGEIIQAAFLRLVRHNSTNIIMPPDSQSESPQRNGHSKYGRQKVSCIRRQSFTPYFTATMSRKCALRLKT